MGILDKILNYISGAETSSAAYKPTTPYTGTLPKGLVKNGTKGADAKAVQTFLNWCMKSGLAVDGIVGAKTVAAIKKYQKQYGLAVDGIFGAKSLAKAKSIVDAHKPKPASTIIDKEIEACKVQAEWEKNAIYKWQENPTVPKSKKKATCVTYVACVLQRIGILKSGQYIWITTKGKVVGANSKMTVTYMKGTLKSNKAKLKKGDIVIGGNGKVGAGAGSHIFILTGQWSGDNPYIYDQESANRVKKGKVPQHTWKGSFKTIARIRLK